jgi:hypothetical protein
LRALYWYLAQNREQMFAMPLCTDPDNGRRSTPPILAVSALFLRAYEGVSFAELVERTNYDCAGR